MQITERNLGHVHYTGVHSNKDYLIGASQECARLIRIVDNIVLHIIIINRIMIELYHSMQSFHLKRS